jgi:uncharacterized protein (TIGR01777 family)
VRIAVTGSSGLVGRPLVAALRADGHDVIRLVRRAPAAADERSWQPERGRLDPALLDGLDSVVHLAGAGIGDRRWTSSYRAQILRSRVDGTRALSDAMAEMRHPPRLFLSASAVGYYGDTGEEAVDEAARAGTGFLADLVQDWEAASTPARDRGVRVVLARSGIVLSRSGGALAKVLPLFRAGLGGRLGSGRQWVSWIAQPDHLAALRFLLRDDGLAGPVNLTAPEPARNRDYTTAIARAVHRPALLPVPAPLLRLALGGFADEAVLVSQRVVPVRLEDAGFDFAYADVDAAMRAVIG